eukprot:2817992-Rhodomonas_salina.1
MRWGWRVGGLEEGKEGERRRCKGSGGQHRVSARHAEHVTGSEEVTWHAEQQPRGHVTDRAAVSCNSSAATSQAEHSAQQSSGQVTGSREVT